MIVCILTDCNLSWWSNKVDEVLKAFTRGHVIEVGVDGGPENVQ